MAKARSNEIVLLHPCWWWDCPGCGTENYCRSVRAEFADKDELIEMVMAAEDVSKLDAEQMMDNGLTPEFHTRPDDVSCAKCGVSYPCKSDNEDGDQ